MRRAAFLSSLLACFCFLANIADAAEKRVALVIGNGAYVHAGALRNPRNDASDVAAKLRALGFDVIEGLDLEKRAMEVHIRDFGNAIEDADVALFYYAGHGMLVRGKNHLAPVDARFKSESDIDFETIDFDLVLRQMERSTRINLVFLDACRDNPLALNAAQTRGSNVSRGLGRIERTLGTLIAFATEPGSVAADGEGRNSPFTRALLAHMDTPGLSVSDMMIEVRNEVLRETKKRQMPWDNSSLTGRFFFNPAVEKLAEPPQPSNDLLTLRDEFKKLQLEQAARLEAQQNELAALRQKFGSSENKDDRTAKENAPTNLGPEKVEPGAPVIAPVPDVAEAEPLGEAGAVAAVVPAIEAAASESAVKPDPVPAAKANASQVGEPAQPAPEAPSPEGKNEDAPQKEIETAAVDQGEAAGEPEAVPDPDPEVREADLIREIQIALDAIGCYRGKIDSKWGKNSQAAVERFNALSDHELDTEGPSAEIVDALAKWQGGNCAAEQQPHQAAPAPKAQPKAKPVERVKPVQRLKPVERARKREQARERIYRARPAQRVRKQRANRPHIARQRPARRQKSAPDRGFAESELRRTFPNQAWPD